MIGGLPGNAFVFMEFQQICGIAEAVTLFAAAFVLDLLELVESFLELTGEARAVQAEDGELVDGGSVCGVGAFGKEFSFEARDAVETPTGVGEFLDELGFDGVGGLVLVEKILAMLFESGRVFGGQDAGAGSESMAERVAGGPLFALVGAGAGRVLRVLAIDGCAEDGNGR